jgi:hypothetical protein
MSHLFTLYTHLFFKNLTPSLRGSPSSSTVTVTPSVTPDVTLGDAFGDASPGSRMNGSRRTAGLLIRKIAQSFRSRVNFQSLARSASAIDRTL